MEKTPNLFDYATSELSQDAFLAWLMHWSDKKYEKIDENLNVCAASFVREILKENNSYIIDKIEVKKQWENIDVSALVNDQYFIVIEDKIDTKEHSNQLERYKKIAEEKYKKAGIELKFIYFKMEEQCRYTNTNIEKVGFSLFKRDKMLSILKKYIDETEKSKQNAIIFDYYNNLKNLDEKINSYKTKSIKDWTRYSWQGFYSMLQEKGIDGLWGYISNRAGGFLGFYWHWIGFKCNEQQYQHHIQLEEHKLVFRIIGVSEKNKQKEVREFYRKYLFEKAKEFNINISSSDYKTTGETMGAAKLNDEYRITDKNGLLDIDATVNNLKKIMEFMDEVGKEIAKN